MFTISFVSMFEMVFEHLEADLRPEDTSNIDGLFRIVVVDVVWTRHHLQISNTIGIDRLHDGEQKKKTE